MGKLKRRIFPEDIVINIGKNVPIPECPIPGHRSSLSEIATHRCLLFSYGYLQLGNKKIYTIKCMSRHLIHKMSLLKYSRCARVTNSMFILTCI